MTHHAASRLPSLRPLAPSADISKTGVIVGILFCSVSPVDNNITAQKITPPSRKCRQARHGTATIIRASDAVTPMSRHIMTLAHRRTRPAPPRILSLWIFEQRRCFLLARTGLPHICVSACRGRRTRALTGLDSRRRHAALPTTIAEAAFTWLRLHRDGIRWAGYAQRLNLGHLRPFSDNKASNGAI